jgi:hypothetical protein
MPLAVLTMALMTMALMTMAKTMITRTLKVIKATTAITMTGMIMDMGAPMGTAMAINTIRITITIMIMTMGSSGDTTTTRPPALASPSPPGLL